MAIRRWVREGHGFIGVGEPTAYAKGGRFFALADVLGVDKEISLTLSEDKYNVQKQSHFITEDVQGEIDYGEGMKNIYALEGAQVLDIAFSDRFRRSVNVGEVLLAANEYGKGRGVYVAGLPYSAQNARLLYRAMFWAAHKEGEMQRVFPLTRRRNAPIIPKRTDTPSSTTRRRPCRRIFTTKTERASFSLYSRIRSYGNNKKPTARSAFFMCGVNYTIKCNR